MKNERPKEEWLRLRFKMLAVTIIAMIVIGIAMFLSDRFRELIYANIVSIIIIVALLLYLVHIKMVLDPRSKDKIKESSKKAENYEQILIAMVSDTAKSIRTVNLENGQSEHLYIYDNKIIKEHIGDWEKWIVTQTKNINADDYDRVYSSICMSRLDTLKEGATYRINYRSCLKDESGFFRHYTTTASVTYIDDTKTAILTTMENTDVVINELKQKKLLESAASIYISMQDIDIANDTIQTISCAEHVFDLMGYEADNAQEAIRKAIRKLVDEQYIEDMMEFVDLSTIDVRMAGVRTISMEFIGKVSGWCQARFIAVNYNEAGSLSRVLWLMKDIDDERKKSNRLRYLSETDQMTGINNRGSGESKIKEYLEKGHCGMFCVLDVDKFKTINDTFGHGVGDKVLIVIARCLKESFGEKDIVMRLGGDEFAVFVDELTDKEAAANILNRIIDKIDNIYIRELENYNITISFGAAFKLKDDGIDFETLYHNADKNTYVSKKKEGSCYTIS